MPIIKFLPMENKIEVPAGTTVLEAEQLAGICQDSPCGGNGRCRKCKILINGEEKLACQTIVRENMTVTVQELPQEIQILADGIVSAVTVKPVQTGKYHIGVDIGTTTVVVYLLDGRTGEALDSRSMLNPQFPYGSDVISRIQAALSGKLSKLSEAIRGGVWSLISELCQENHANVHEIGTVAVVANPAMQQLFLKISPENLAKPPFSPILSQTEIIPLSDYFPLKSPGKLLIVPDIAGYVGADTVGCILSTGMYRDKQMTLLIDIGTNGEMVLGNCDRMIACSTAAGPALEGGRISCGMRGSTGAIDHVWIKDDSIQYSVIGNTEATGICGSGIIDLTAVLLERDIINRRGRIHKDYLEHEKNRYYSLTEHISFTQDDVREVQMAKGAIAAGIQLMMEQSGVSMDEIDRVILCGAFGNYMRPESACKIGLIPEELLGRIQAGKNAAGMGSQQMALNEELFFLSEALVEKTEALELASIPGFSRAYAANMMFSAQSDTSKRL